MVFSNAFARTMKINKGLHSETKQNKGSEGKKKRCPEFNLQKMVDHWSHHL